MFGAEVEHPRERDLGIGRGARSRDLRERRVLRDPSCAAWPAERRVGDEGELEVRAALDEAASHGVSSNLLSAT